MTYTACFSGGVIDLVRCWDYISLVGYLVVMGLCVSVLWDIYLEKLRAKKKDRENEQCDCESGNASSGNLGNLRNTNLQRTSGNLKVMLANHHAGIDKTQKLSWGARFVQKPLALCRAIIGHRNIFGRLIHKRVTMTPNVQSSGTRDQPA